MDYPLKEAALHLRTAIRIGSRSRRGRICPENKPRVADILSVCAGLVMIDEESSIIRLIHYTTQEYFDRTREYWFPAAEAEITDVCVSYLSVRSFETGPCRTENELKKRLRLNMLYNYSTHNWGHHARMASTVSPGVTDFLECQMKVEASSQALTRHNSQRWYAQSTQTTGLHLAAYFGVEKSVKAISHEQVATDAKDHDARTPLSWASENGRETVVKQLLEKGANPNSKDEYLQIELRRAERSGISGIMKELHDVESSSQCSRTPLSWAVNEGHEAVVKQPLEGGADLESKDESCRTPLSRAANKGYTAIVRHLLEKGADLESKNRWNRTPLSWAAEHGHEAVVKQLLEKGADPLSAFIPHGENESD